VLAYELFVRWRHDLDRQRLEPLVPAQREEGVVLFLLLRRPGLTLGEDLLEARFDLSILGLGRPRLGSAPGLFGLVVTGLGVLVLGDLFGVVFHVVRFLVRPGGTGPDRSCARGRSPGRRTGSGAFRVPAAA